MDGLDEVRPSRQAQPAAYDESKGETMTTSKWRNALSLIFGLAAVVGFETTFGLNKWKGFDPDRVQGETYLTVDEITREALKMFISSNEFLSAVIADP